MPPDIQANWPQVALIGGIAVLFVLFFVVNAIRGPKPVSPPRPQEPQDRVRGWSALVLWLAFLVAIAPGLLAEFRTTALVVGGLALLVGVVAALQRKPRTNFGEWEVLLAPALLMLIWMNVERS